MARSTRLIVISFAVLGALLAGTYALRSSLTRQEVTPTPYSPAVPQARVMALGRIEPITELVRVAAPAGQDSGRIAELLVAEGDWVNKGQIIATLDTRARLEAALRQSSATLALRQAALWKLIADLDNQEKTLTAALEQQEAQRDRSKWDFDRLSRLQKSGLYSDTALIDKRLVLESATQAHESARFLLERNRRRDNTGIRIDEAGARAEVAVAEAALSKAQADLEFSAIRAPVQGRVLRRLGRPGEQIGQEGLAEIGDTRVMMVRGEVFESDLRRVETGSAVVVKSRALSEPLQGKVDRVGLKVNRQSIIGEDPAAALDARVIEVMIRLDTASSARAAGLTGLQVRVFFGAEAGT
jgi:HlyD family secretion protein